MDRRAVEVARQKVDRALVPDRAVVVRRDRVLVLAHVPDLAVGVFREVEVVAAVGDAVSAEVVAEVDRQQFERNVRLCSAIRKMRAVKFQPNVRKLLIRTMKNMSKKASNKPKDWKKSYQMTSATVAMKALSTMTATKGEFEAISFGQAWLN